MIRVTGINEIMFTRGDTLPLEIKIKNKLTKKEYLKMANVPWIDRNYFITDNYTAALYYTQD